MQFIFYKKIQTKKIRLNRQDLVPQCSAPQATCLPIELRGISGSERNRHCQNKRSMNSAGSLALRRCQVYAKKYPERRYDSFPDMGTLPHIATDTQPEPWIFFDARLPNHPVHCRWPNISSVSSKNLLLILSKALDWWLFVPRCILASVRKTKLHNKIFKWFYRSSYIYSKTLSAVEARVYSTRFTWSNTFKINKS